MCSILTQVIITSYFLLKIRRNFHILMEGFIFLNLYRSGTLFQIFCHASFVLRLSTLSVSEGKVRLMLLYFWLLIFVHNTTTNKIYYSSAKQKKTCTAKCPIYPSPYNSSMLPIYPFSWATTICISW